MGVGPLARVCVEVGWCVRKVFNTGYSLVLTGATPFCLNGLWENLSLSSREMNLIQLENESHSFRNQSFESIQFFCCLYVQYPLRTKGVTYIF